LLASLVDVRHADREMAEAAAEGIGLRLLPIMGQLDDGAVVLIAIADKGQGEFAGRIVALAQQLHAELLGVEMQRLIEILDAKHRVQKAGSGDRHGGLLLWLARGLATLPRRDNGEDPVGGVAARRPAAN